MTVPPLPRLGILGGGQLGRMAALAAARLGIPVHIYTPEADSPATQVAPHVTVAAWEGEAALAAFAASVDAITLEFENVPLATARFLAARTPMRPGPEVLAIAQDRALEKEAIEAAGLETVAWAPVTNEEPVDFAAYPELFPGILKTARLGYDGKGQRAVASADELMAAWAELGQVACVLEARLDFRMEISVILARDAAGRIVSYPAVENRHEEGILRRTIAPAPLPAAWLDAADAAARQLARHLQLEGMLAVEMFVTDAGLVINEIAPRPHNSGHWTIEGCRISQFETQIRAALGLPILEPDPLFGATMTNLLGEEAGDWPGLMRASMALHLYGKAEARPGRKMGHLTQLTGRWPARG